MCYFLYRIILDCGDIKTIGVLKAARIVSLRGKEQARKGRNQKGRMQMKINLLCAVALAVVVGCKYDGGGGAAAPVPDKWAALTGLPCVAAPDKAELLDESGPLALFAGETAEDVDSMTL